MPTTIDFIILAKWAGITAIVSAALTVIAFVFKWGLRFRLVGATGFMIVLTAGLITLGLVPFTRTVIPGAIRYTVVFDTGATQSVIAVPPTITDDQLDATLRQAASDLYSPGRVGRGGNQLIIRARTIVHPNSTSSQPIYVAEVKRSLSERDDLDLDISIDEKKLALARQIAGVNLDEAGQPQSE